MSHEIYLFGSLTRGDITPTSDVDVLLIPEGRDTADNYPPNWSKYSRDTIADYFKNGRLFAWHLYLEAKCIFSELENPWLFSIGAPSQYLSARDDIIQLRELLLNSLSEIRHGSPNLVYEYGLVYTALRDIAMSASLRLSGAHDFSRMAPYSLSLKCPLDLAIYQLSIEARHSSTRGTTMPGISDEDSFLLLATPLDAWIESILDCL